jgi:hypothetical protein
MMMKDFFYAIGDAFEGFFSVLPTVGNIPNYIAVFIISILFLYWTGKLIQYKKNKEA